MEIMNSQNIVIQRVNNNKNYENGLDAIKILFKTAAQEMLAFTEKIHRHSVYSE